MLSFVFVCLKTQCMLYFLLVTLCVCVCVFVFEAVFLSCPEMSQFTDSVKLLEDTVQAQCHSHVYVHILTRTCAHTHTHTHTHIQAGTRQAFDDQSMSAWEPLRESAHTHTCMCVNTVSCMRCESSVGHRAVTLCSVDVLGEFPL